jgi:hypothetical protein
MDNVKVSGVYGGTGGIEVYLDCEPAHVQEMVMTGRKRALDEAKKAGHQVNTVLDEQGPLPICRDSGRLVVSTKLTDPAAMQAIKVASDTGNLLYRKKFVLSFTG